MAGSRGLWGLEGKAPPAPLSFWVAARVLGSWPSSSNLCICDHITASFSVLNAPRDGDTCGGPKFVDIHRLQTSDTAVLGDHFSRYQEGDPKFTSPARVTLNQTCTSNSPTPGNPHASQINWLSSHNPTAPQNLHPCHLPGVRVTPTKTPTSKAPKSVV